MRLDLTYRARTPRLRRLALPITALVVAASACGDDGVSPPRAGLYRDRIAAGLTERPDAPAVALGADGSRLVVHATADGERLAAGTITVGGRGTLAVEPDDDGLPRRVVVGSRALLFSNWRTDRVDVAFVDSTGQIEVRRDVEIPAAARRYAEGLQSGAAALALSRVAAPAGSGAPDPSEAAEWMRLVANSGGLASCIGTALGWIPTPASPAVLGLFSAGCISTVVDLVAQIRREEVDPFFQSISAANLLAGSHGCVAQAEQCAQVAADAANVILARVNEWVRSREEELTLAEGALQLGGGAVQVTLTWNTSADVDLWVTDPAGSTITYAQPSAPSGGRLDRDDTDGAGPENVFWPTNGAPPGSYRVRVQLFSGAAPTSFTVLVSAAGHTRQYTGTLTTPRQTLDVVTFTLGQPLPNVAPAPVYALTPTDFKPR